MYNTYFALMCVVVLMFCVEYSKPTETEPEPVKEELKLYATNNSQGLMEITCGGPIGRSISFDWQAPGIGHYHEMAHIDVLTNVRKEANVTVKWGANLRSVTFTKHWVDCAAVQGRTYVCMAVLDVISAKVTEACSFDANKPRPLIHPYVEGGARNVILNEKN